MNIGIIGLGRMGHAIAARLVSGGYEVIAYDLSSEALQAVVQVGAAPASSLAEVVAKARIVWLMVPAGKIVDHLLLQLQQHLQPGDIVVDGGNSFFKDSIRRAQQLATQKIIFLDCGTSGGLQGAVDGFCLMIGGEREAFDTLEPALKTISAPHRYAYVGPSGAGHYVKMVHNGIEYSLLQAYAEGFALLAGQQDYPNLDLEKISALWNHGSIIRSWILELLEKVFAQHGQTLNDVSGILAQGGTGLWTAQEADKNNIAMPLLHEALILRHLSATSGQDEYANKIVALLRHQFGGHPYTLKKDEKNDENN